MSVSRTLRVAWLFALPPLAACAARGVRPPAERDAPAASGVPVAERVLDEVELARGADIFESSCAVCHGDLGRGDGPAAPWLFPGAPDFGQGRFRLVSTENSVPTRADLVGTLRRGIPGSSMPSWSTLSDADLERVAAFVQRLAVDGLADVLASELSDDGRGLTFAQAYELAEERMRPSAVIEPLPEVRVTDRLLARGRELYLRDCATCHREDGRGHVEPRYDESGQTNWARDFVAGILKGGGTPEDLHRRIRCGMPGSAMPAFAFDDPLDGAAVVAYVRSLIPLGEEQRLVLRRERIEARAVEQLPLDPDDPAWDAAPETMVVLAPLWWKSGAVLEAYVAACHDGERLSIRVRWSDQSSESDVFSDVQNPDGVALQFSSALEPPLFAMGSEERTTAMWHWKSLRLAEVAGGLELLERFPHRTGRAFTGEVTLDVPIYHLAEGLPTTSTTVDRLDASGVGAVQVHREAATGEVEAAVEARPRWEGGVWRVVFTRDLVTGRSDEPTFRVGESVHLALALWNGSAGDRRGQKSISIWQELILSRHAEDREGSQATDSWR